MVDKLNSNSGQPKTIKSSMFNSLHEFINDLTTKNIFDDKKLMELAKIAKDSISGISPYGLNYNDQMKNKIKVSMKTLNDAINDSIEELPKTEDQTGTCRVRLSRSNHRTDQQERRDFHRVFINRHELDYYSNGATPILLFLKDLSGSTIQICKFMKCEPDR